MRIIYVVLSIAWLYVIVSAVFYYLAGAPEAVAPVG